MQFDPSQVQVYVLPVFDDLKTKEETEAPEPESGSKAEHFQPFDAQKAGVEGATTGSDGISLANMSDEEKVAFSERFKNNNFIQENSLLTDAQEFAETIREGARLYSEQLTGEAEKRYAEAAKALEEAEAIKKNAEAERSRLIREAQQQVESIKKNAYQEGFKSGKHEGAQQRYEEMAPYVTQFESVLTQLADLRKVIRFQGEQELVQLAVMIARHVVLEELSINENVLRNILVDALRDIETLGKLRVFLNPEDYEFLQHSKADLERYIKDEQTLVIRSNIDVQPGAILIETDETIVNFSFQKRFQELEDALSRKLAERQAHLHEVDMDAYDFTPPEELGEGDAQFT